MDITSFFFLVLTGLTSLFVPQEFTVPVTVTINPIYQLDLEVNVITERVLPGDNITALIQLNKTGYLGEITVDLNYSVFKSKKETIISGSDTVNVAGYVEKNITVSLPSDIKPSLYYLAVTASHTQATGDSDYDRFWVRRKTVGLLSILDFLRITFINI